MLRTGIREMDFVRLAAPPIADIDSGDGYVVKFVAVGIGGCGALMCRVKALDLGIKEKAVDESPDTPRGYEQ
jgi:hypothetical protein